jgi:hypothetical protein
VYKPRKYTFDFERTKAGGNLAWYALSLTGHIENLEDKAHDLSDERDR